LYLSYYTSKFLVLQFINKINEKLFKIIKRNDKITKMGLKSDTNFNYDVLVIGAGHAGCEASHAAARLGCKTLLTTIDLKSVAYLACNPSIGGAGKSHLVYEIDALGGLMAQIADKTAIQMRTLNHGNGPAVQALRAQVDKHAYHATMLETLRTIPNLTIRECEVAGILTGAAPKADKDNAQLGRHITGVTLTTGEKITAHTVIVATGVYLNGQVLIGHTSKPSGPQGFAPATCLTKSLVDLGVEIRRFKTGTPPRVTAASIDYSACIPQPGDTDSHFSFMSTTPIQNAVKCHLTYTNEKTHQVIKDNLQQSAMYSGLIKGVGARYCPSIEDKIVRFAHANRHQIFLEPESLSTDEVYLQGISTSLPADIQAKFVHTIAGLENAKIVRNAYAIEYDCINSLQLLPTLEYKGCRGLYFAGQVNGTSGYEEAAAQGLVAGINAAKAASRVSASETCERSEASGGSDAKCATGGVVFSRTNSYIGVLIDDLVTLGTNEPYRMFTSRAEHRLYLRQDNADQRLTPLGREIGLVDDTRWNMFCEKMQLIKDGHQLETVINEKKYAGYLAREQAKIAEVQRCEQTLLPQNFDYTQITALRKESQLKLNQIQPQNIAQASRISGVTPADINILLIWLRKHFTLSVPHIKPAKNCSAYNQHHPADN